MLDRDPVNKISIIFKIPIIVSETQFLKNAPTWYCQFWSFVNQQLFYICQRLKQHNKCSHKTTKITQFTAINITNKILKGIKLQNEQFNN